MSANGKQTTLGSASAMELFTPPVNTKLAQTMSAPECASLSSLCGAPHGLTDTHKDCLNQDLLRFLQQ